MLILNSYSGAINNVIRTTLNIEKRFEITKNTLLYKDLGAGMLDLYHLATELEDALNCSILDEEIEGWVCVGDIYRSLKVRD